jgi:very-short-patch-repair endonuclease
MGKGLRNSDPSLWALARDQHGVITRAQLLRAGLTSKAIEVRTRGGRLHAIHRGVYAVGRPQLTLRGWWSGAVLRCGKGALLSHLSAGFLWRICGRDTGSEGEVDRPSWIHVSVDAGKTHKLSGVRIHKRRYLPGSDRALCDRIPVTSPARTLIDLATVLESGQLEAAVNAADKRDVIDPERLRSEIESHRGTAGVPALGALLDRHTFAVTDSELERRFLRLVRRAGLPKPFTQQRVNGYLVDFFWPELKLVVETDGLRYHRTATQQSRDRERDQAHVAAGLIALRFSHAQVRYDPERVVETLRAVAK